MSTYSLFKRKIVGPSLSGKLSLSLKRLQLMHTLLEFDNKIGLSVEDSFPRGHEKGDVHGQQLGGTNSI